MTVASLSHSLSEVWLGCYCSSLKFVVLLIVRSYLQIINMDARNKKKIAILLGAAALVLKAKEEKKEKRKRKVWVRSWLAKRDAGRGVLDMVGNELRVEDPASYRNFLRMDENSFRILLNLVRPQIAKQDTQFRQSISAENRLSLTLRFLAAGETLVSLSYATRIAHNTISNIIWETLPVIAEVLEEQYLKVPQSEEEWNEIAKSFDKNWNFPNCLGAMDGKHITFRPLRSSGSFFRNYKGSDSIVLLALVDANYKFLVIDVGVNGRISDGGVFSRSMFSEALANNTLNIPPPRALPHRNMEVPFVIVADDAFPLEQNIMKPFRFNGLSNQQEIYNYRLSRARRIVENAFGILSNRFRILLVPMCYSETKVELVTKVCCILHNFLIDKNGTNYINQQDERNIECRLPALAQQCGNRTASNARDIRNEFLEYFNNEGAVEWQQRHLDRTNC